MLEVAVCDDNEMDLTIVSDMLHEIFSELKQECHITAYSSPALLLDRQKKIDIGILDIVMPGCNGIDLGQKLKQKFPEIVLLYATGYEDYYKQVINQVHAFSFLTKPIDRAELKTQISECIQGTANRRQATTFIFENVLDKNGRQLASIQLNADDILYCEYIKTQRLVSIVLEHEVYFYKAVFETLSGLLENYGFAVNCRGCTVNLSHIKKIKGYTIYLDNGRELPLTQKRVLDFKEKMSSYIHKIGC